MSSLDTARELAAKLTAAGLDATCDPRSATPPCVLIGPPAMTFGVGCGAEAVFALFALAPATGNEDAWRALDDMLAILYAELPIERTSFVAYPLSPDSPTLPAYRVEFTHGTDL